MASTLHPGEEPEQAAQRRRQVLAPTLERATTAGPAGSVVPLPPAAQLGRFVILRQLGVGGMGTVFAAYDEQLDRKVALKLLHAQDPTGYIQRARALREAKALARVTHPRVVSVYEVGQADQQLYLAMEYVDGITLRSWQHARPRGWREVLLMYLRAGEGLQAAHEAGVVHRDFKPDNVIVGKDGLPRVADFGVAQLRWQPVGEVGGEEPVPSACGEPATTLGGVSGTPGYMSPEQHAGRRSDAASDQFSFCVSLYEALYGRLPFAGQAPVGPGLRQHIAPRPPPPGSPVPSELLSILARGLSAEPADRYPSMAALLRELSAEHAQTAASAARTRRGITLAFAGVGLLTWLLAHHLAVRYQRIAPHAIGLSLVVLFVFLLAGYTHRHVLRVNAFHRRVWTLITINIVQNLLMRLVVARTAQVPFRAAFAMEMIVWTGTTLAMATLPVRSLAWVPGIPLLAGATALFVEGVPRQLLLLAYPITVMSLLWGWRREARAAFKADGEDRP